MTTKGEITTVMRPQFRGSYLLVSLLPAAAILLNAQRAANPTTPQNPPALERTTLPIPPEKNSVTQHEVMVDGKQIRYNATAGNLLIEGDDEQPNASFFYVAYTMDGVTDPKVRPITFLYNGGPGSASMWLHMGSVGPVRVVTASPVATGSGPYQIVPNEYSLIDRTDLVFIDAIGTGYSRAVGKGIIRDFAGTDQDVRAFEKFIYKYVSVNHRWNSPKFLFGESYGTTRSAALVDSLQNSGMAFNGVILMSSILNYFSNAPGSDTLFIGNLPSYAAIADHYEKVSHKGKDLKAFLDEVRAFARGPYSEALAQGHALPAAQVDAIAQKLSGYTGLSVAYIKEANLRVSPARFRKELLRDQRTIVGRYDARFEGTDSDAAGETPSYDPSDTGINSVFTSALHDYLERELKYTSSEMYYPSGPGINNAWDHTHRIGSAAPTGGGTGGAMRDAYVAGDLADAIRKNPKLKVFSANGLFDLATPFFITEYDLAHVELEPKLRNNIEFAYYPAGHMIYLNVDALKQFKSDAASFYTRAISN
jgi:carboxypeptidase C (cathepsin A)